MSFCPLLSTAEKKIECNEQCEWYTYDQDNQHNLEGQCCLITICEHLYDIRNNTNSK